jgi:hypothetical protein
MRRSSSSSARNRSVSPCWWRLLRQQVVYVLLGVIGLWNVWMVFHLVVEVQPSSSSISDEEAAAASILLLGRSSKAGKNSLLMGASSSTSKIRPERKRLHGRDRNTTADADRQRRRQPNHAPCVRPECIARRAASMARSFIPAQHQTWRVQVLPPVDPPNTSYKYSGLIYVKVPKTGSSTIAGVALRIARTHHVEVHYDHSSGQEYGAESSRDPLHSLLFASIRDPAERALSYLAYEASRNGQEMSMNVESLLESLHAMDRLGAVQKSDGRGGTQLAFTSLQSIPPQSAWKSSFPEYVVRADRVEQHAAAIVNGYDFLIVTDRMDESLVALAMLLGISVRDVVVFSSKIAARKNIHHTKNQTTFQQPEEKEPPQFLAIHDTANAGGGMSCVPLQHIPTELVNDPQIQDFLHSDHWHAMNYGDCLLHAAATASLDQTIHDLGATEFQWNLAEYRRLVAMAKDYCQNGQKGQDNQVQGPCSSNGTLQLKVASEDCYAGDYGCGHKCIDKMINEME